LLAEAVAAGVIAGVPHAIHATGSTHALIRETLHEDMLTALSSTSNRGRAHSPRWIPTMNPELT
jgi:hypothetical protein